MKILTYLCCITVSLNIFAFNDPKYGGTVYFQGASGIEGKGKLVVYAHYTNVELAKKPIAFFKYEAPKFPQAFVITPKNLADLRFSLKDQMYLEAKYFFSNDKQYLTTKNKVEGPFKIGDKGIKLHLDVKIHEDTK